MNKRINGTLRTGFTLAELLVVIVIIVLLPAILIPAIQQNSEQHKNIICRDNVKQWGLMLAMYTNDNDGHLTPGFNVLYGMWMIKLRPYGTDSNNIRLCPKATKLLSTVPDMVTDPCTAWGIYGDPGYGGGWIPAFGEKGLYGSYGINEWANDPMQPGDLYQISPADLPHYWRTIYQKNPNTIPVFGDSVWEGTKVFYTDNPPAVPARPNGMGMLWGMWNFCLPRHQSGNEYTVNFVFMDISARKIPIKQLWKQKWSPLFRTDRNITSWPAWMTPP